MPFTPKDSNGLSRRQIAYQQAFRDMPTGALVRYEDMPFDQPTMHAIKDGIARLMEGDQQRTLATERGRGWRIVAGVAQADLADRGRRLATKRMGRELGRVQAVDRRELSGQEQQRVDDVYIRIAVAHQQIRSSGRKLGLEDIQRWQEEAA